MKKIITLLLLLSGATTAMAQGEANNWYFGANAGMRFQEDGTVVPLSDGQLFTTEGCSTISDSDGNLLFYTDGRNVWDRNHIKMPNGNYDLGTGLFGDPSSSQSGIIVPKKDDPDIYYIFTVDEPHHQNAGVYPNQFNDIYFEPGGVTGSVPTDDDGFNNGLNYSVIDLSVTGANGSIGDVVTRNVHLLTYNPDNVEEAKYKCSEKITAVKNNNGSGFWVIAHFLDKFYSFSVDADGVNETPVVTQLDPFITTLGYRRNAIGYLKASPDGNKLAIAHMQKSTVAGAVTDDGVVYLYDFNDATGIVSNPLQISQNCSPYGVEFSQEAKKLYISYNNTGTITGVHQYNLLSGDIPGSDILVANAAQSGALQLGPNGKIYRAVANSQFLDVIHNPEEDGALCGYQVNGQLISNSPFRVAALGLPPFITSLFSASILVANNCHGEPTQFQINVNNSFDSVEWDFGDGSPVSTEISPSHTYANTGTYNVIATVTRQGETQQVSREVTINSVPVANAAPNITECDPDNNGFATFALSANDDDILGGQSADVFEVRYFTSQEDADANANPVNAGAFANTSNPQTIFARIQNKNNNDCYATTSFVINASNTPTLNGNSFAVCDDDEDGDDTNGQAKFNLNAVTEALVQNHLQFTTTYYASEADAQVPVNPLPQLFNNTVANSQTVYARIVNNASTDCFGILPITLTVNPLPVPVPGATLVQCDLGLAPDGITQFILTEADNLFTGGNNGFTVAYYLNDTDAQNDASAIGPEYTNTVNPQQISVKVVNTVTGCVRIQPLTLQVNTNTTAAVMLEECDDDGAEDGIATFNLTDAGLEDGSNTVTYYATPADALLEQNAINSSFTNTTAHQQSVYARIENNNDCTALQEIVLVVRPLPNIDTEGEARVCLNTNAFITLDAGVNGSTNGLTYLWSTEETSATIRVNQPGTYSVTVTNAFGCKKERTITVTPSNVAVINDIVVKDLRDNNTITVFVSPAGNVNTTYVYSLNEPDGPFQESNVFENVPAGVHTVYVSDSNGCGVVSEDVAVLGIPAFFSPNGDGVNDTWNVLGMNPVFYIDGTINIFDRYGKLLAGISPKSRGWDGTYNGQRLPATDYWYVLTLENGRMVKGHFSLIR